MLERLPQQFRELQEITMQTDTRDILAHKPRGSLKATRTISSSTSMLM